VFKGFSRCLIVAIFGRRRIQATCALGFAARNNQSSPVRVECLLACTLRLCRAPVGQRRPSTAKAALLMLLAKKKFEARYFFRHRYVCSRVLLCVIILGGAPGLISVSNCVLRGWSTMNEIKE